MEVLMADREDTRTLSLADQRVVYKLCFEFLEAQLEMTTKLTKGEITSEEAARTSADLVQWMSWTLGGENPEFVVAKDWSGAQLGRYLRTKFAADLIELPEEDRVNFEADESIIIYAMVRFMGEVQDLIEVVQTHSDMSAEEDARRYHELCVRWTELFMNKPYKTIVVAE